MTRATWEEMHRVARYVRRTGVFPPDIPVERLGQGVEKTAYATPVFPGWVFKVTHHPYPGHPCEATTYHRVPPALRPRTAHYPLRHEDDRAYVQIQEKCQPVGHAGYKDPLKTSFSIFQERMHHLGFGDQHAYNVGLTTDGRLVTMDWGLHRKETRSEHFTPLPGGTNEFHPISATPPKRAPHVQVLHGLRGILQQAGGRLGGVLPGDTPSGVPAGGESASRRLRDLPPLKFYDDCGSFPRNYF